MLSMEEVLNQIFSAVAQVLVFVLIPFIIYVFRKDRSHGFAHYIGMTRPGWKAMGLAAAASILFVAAGVLMAMRDAEMLALLHAPKTVTGHLRALGLNEHSIVILLIIALLKTSLAEEILFRGFIGKQLIRRIGFRMGNLLQSLIFGFVHLVLFWAVLHAGPGPCTFIFVFSTFAGWCVGYIKEKYANGSMVPGWLAHGMGNSISYYIIAFLL